MKIKRFNQLNENIDLNHFDLNGGISDEEYGIITNFINNLIIKNDEDKLTDEEKVISEILLMISKNQRTENFDFNTHYHRRLGFIKANKNK